MAKLSIKKDDYVKIIAGKDKGRTAHVISVDIKNNRATVEGKGVSPIKKSVKARKASDKSGIIDMPSTIHVSNLMPLCAGCNKPTRVGYKIVDGKKVRVCKKCGEILETKKIIEKKAKATVKKRVKVDRVEVDNEVENLENIEATDSSATAEAVEEKVEAAANAVEKDEAAAAVETVAEAKETIKE